MNTDPNAFWSQCQRIIQGAETIKNYGQVIQVIGLVIEGIGPASAIGDICHLKIRNGEKMIPAEVVGFREHKTLLMPLGDTRGIEPGCKIIPMGFPAKARVGKNLLGRVLDGMGNPLDQKGPLNLTEERSLYATPSNPILRQRISAAIDVGIKTINGLAH